MSIRRRFFRRESSTQGRKYNSGTHNFGTESGEGARGGKSVDCQENHPQAHPLPPKHSHTPRRSISGRQRAAAVGIRATESGGKVIKGGYL
jgi:hypothetical protein